METSKISSLITEKLFKQTDRLYQDVFVGIFRNINNSSYSIENHCKTIFSTAKGRGHAGWFPNAWTKTEQAFIKSTEEVAIDFNTKIKNIKIRRQIYNFVQKNHADRLDKKDNPTETETKQALEVLVELGSKKSVEIVKCFFDKDDEALNCLTKLTQHHAVKIEIKDYKDYISKFTANVIKIIEKYVTKGDDEKKVIKDIQKFQKFVLEKLEQQKTEIVLLPTFTMPGGNIELTKFEDKNETHSIQSTDTTTETILEAQPCSMHYESLSKLEEIIGREKEIDGKKWEGRTDISILPILFSYEKYLRAFMDDVFNKGKYKEDKLKKHLTKSLEYNFPEPYSEENVVAFLEAEWNVDEANDQKQIAVWQEGDKSKTCYTALNINLVDKKNKLKAYNQIWMYCNIVYPKGHRLSSLNQRLLLFAQLTHDLEENHYVFDRKELSDERKQIHEKRMRSVILKWKFGQKKDIKNLNIKPIQSSNIEELKENKDINTESKSLEGKLKECNLKIEEYKKNIDELKRKIANAHKEETEVPKEITKYDEYEKKLSVYLSSVSSEKRFKELDLIPNFSPQGITNHRPSETGEHKVAILWVNPGGGGEGCYYLAAGGCKLYWSIENEFHKAGIKISGKLGLKREIFLGEDKSGWFSSPRNLQSFLAKKNITLAGEGNITKKNMDIHSDGADPIIVKIPKELISKEKEWNQNCQCKCYAVEVPIKEFSDYLLNTLKIEAEEESMKKLKILAEYKETSSVKKYNECVKALNKEIVEVNKVLSSVEEVAVLFEEKLELEPKLKEEKTFKELLGDEEESISNESLDESHLSEESEAAIYKEEKREGEGYNIYRDTKLCAIKDDTKHESSVRISSDIPDENGNINKVILKNITHGIEHAVQEIKKKSFDTKYINDLNYKGFITSIIQFAQQHGGVGNVLEGANEEERKRLEESFINIASENMRAEEASDLSSLKMVLTDEQAKEYLEIAKTFSSEYQKFQKQANMYTGRTERLREDKMIGARLKRIPKEFTEKVVNDAFSRMAQRTR